MGVDEMGEAAEHRANTVQREILQRDLREREHREMNARCFQVAEDCNEFTRLAQAYLVEPRGLRRATVEHARDRRGWGKRHAAFVKAHCAWVEVDDRNLCAYHAACVKRAKAAYDLLIFALGCWTIPEHIVVPRAAI